MHFDVSPGVKRYSRISHTLMQRTLQDNTEPVITAARSKSGPDMFAQHRVPMEVSNQKVTTVIALLFQISLSVIMFWCFGVSSRYSSELVGETGAATY